jgi:carbonic anhydrase
MVFNIFQSQVGARWWRKKMSKFSSYEYRKQPGFDMNTFEGANQNIPMKTLVIHCVDPRAADIPKAVAESLGNEVYPGENVIDKNGTKVGSTALVERLF